MSDAKKRPIGWKAKLALFLPGIFLLGFNIGTGSVTTMAKAGATYGMSLLWTVLISCAATYIMITAYGKQPNSGRSAFPSRHQA